MEPATSPSVNPHRHPGALWELVLSAPRWLLHRGYPPELDDPRLLVRLLRITLVMIVLGILSSWVTVVAKYFTDYDISLNRYFIRFVRECYPGLWFGLIVLVPISRWQGRNVWLTAAAVPVSTIVHQFLSLRFVSLDHGNPSWLYSVLAGSIGGLGLALWMIPPLSPRACLFLFITVIVGIAGYFLTDRVLDDLTYIKQQMTFPFDRYAFFFLVQSSLYLPFNCLVAMVLGWKLSLQHYEAAEAMTPTPT